MRGNCRTESRSGGAAWCSMLAPKARAAGNEYKAEGMEARTLGNDAPPRRQSLHMHGVDVAAASGRDFDFLHGEWVVANRRLLDPMASAADWIAFDTVYSCRPLLNGLGNIDEVLSEEFGSNAALRLFDVQSRSWSIHRASSRDAVLRPPLNGGFAQNVGTFIGEDSLRDRPLLVRHTWLRNLEAPRWEQAFSFDAGTTWVSNWVMDLTRVDWA